jgi:NADH:ubiquinone oxidoreductase subunit
LDESFGGTTIFRFLLLVEAVLKLIAYREAREELQGRLYKGRTKEGEGTSKRRRKIMQRVARAAVPRKWRLFFHKHSNTAVKKTWGKSAMSAKNESSAVLYAVVTIGFESLSLAETKRAWRRGECSTPVACLTGQNTFWSP